MNNVVEVINYFSGTSTIGIDISIPDLNLSVISGREAVPRISCIYLTKMRSPDSVVIVTRKESTGMDPKGGRAKQSACSA
jgi:hypothetical protein